MDNRVMSNEISNAIKNKIPILVDLTPVRGVVCVKI